MGLNGRNIVCIASSSWDAMWVNSQHLMNRFAENNRVLYLNNTGLRTPGVSSADLRKIFKRIRNFFGGVSLKRDNLFVISPIIIPLHRFALVRWLNGVILSAYLRFYLKKLKMEDPILWVFLPTGIDLVGKLKESMVVYHCVDKYSENPGVSAERIQEMEKDLCRRADVVLTTSRVLYEEKKDLNPSTYYFGNVADVDHFSSALKDGTTPPKDLADITGPVIGYQGNIASYKIDLEMIEAVASKRQDWSIVLVGPVGWGDPHTDVRALRRLGNVHFLDRKSYDDLPRYVRFFDVCLIPFTDSDVTQNSFPMKFFEYLALGKPIVSRRLQSLEHLGKDPQICRLASTADEFLQQIQDALDEEQSEKLISRRLELAHANDWNARVGEIGALIEDTIARRQS